MKEDGPDIIQERFDAAVRVIRTIPSSSFQPSREMTLRFYGLYKQATEGPCKAPKPGFYEVEKSAKWHAWKAEESLSKETAMEEYVAELKKIVEMMSLTPEVSDFLDKVGNFYELINEDGNALPTKKVEPLRALTNGPAKDAAAPKPQPSKLSLPLKRPLPHVIDATVNEMLRSAADELSDLEEDDDVGSEAFQDARSHSESDGLRYQRPASSSVSSLGEEGKTGKDSPVFQLLFPELEKLKRRTDRVEQRADEHAQRLLALELTVERMGKQFLALSNSVPRLPPATSGRTPWFLPENRTVQLMYRYWVLFENRLRQYPSLSVFSSILLLTILQLFGSCIRRLLSARRD